MQPNVPEPPDNIEELTCDFADDGVIVYAEVQHVDGDESITVRVNRVYFNGYGFLRAKVTACNGTPFQKWMDGGWVPAADTTIDFHLLLDLRDADGNPVEVEPIPF